MNLSHVGKSKRAFKGTCLLPPSHPLLTIIKYILIWVTFTRVHNERQGRTKTSLMIVMGCAHITSAAGGGEGVSQMMTIADEGGRGGKPNADDC